MTDASTPDRRAAGGLAWILRMAWRDSRRSRRRLLLFVSSMTLGVAALVAVTSFGGNLLTAVDTQAKTLIGADVRITGRAPFSAETEALLDSLGGDQARMVSFASMAYFPKDAATRLARIRALEGGFPFYGEVETAPEGAFARLKEGPFALVDEALMIQFAADVGDDLFIGERRYVIAGKLTKVPGESAASALIGPRIYIPLGGVDENLLGRGSRVDYEAYLKLNQRAGDPEALREHLRPHLQRHDLRIDTIDEVRREWGNALEDLYAFLNLVAFVALLLGGLGVASAIHVYVSGKVDTVATLRCVGATIRQAFLVYVLQAVAMGAVGASMGALAGVGVQYLLPAVLSEFLPVDVSVRVSPLAVAEGMLVGLGVSLVFALLPLLRIRRISPLRALRASVEEQEAGRDTLRILLWGVVILLLFGFALRQTGRWPIALGFTGGVGVVFGSLYLVARSLMAIVRRFFPSRWPYVWRQGLANLYRPGNQTAVLLLALGLGTFLIMTLFLTQRTLLAKIEGFDRSGQPNVVLFDVQSDQVTGVQALIDSLQLVSDPPVPIVTMRIADIKGRSVEELVADTAYTGSRWPLRREYRSSYRGAMTDSERLVSGSFTGTYDGAGSVPISIEADIARDLQVDLGDEVVFNVQGLLLNTIVGSIREVDWQRVSTNFFVIFPTGVVEEAPQFFVLTTRTEGPEERAELQRRTVEAFPNVSIIDLEAILRTADEILGRIALVIRFMALFSILTGLTVLFGAVVTSRFQRVRESVLLRTLGASRRQILAILVVEYVLLGFLAATTGILLSIGASWALAALVFDAPFSPPVVAVLVALLTVSALTVAIGMANSRGVVTRPPLEVLRAEAE